MAYCQFDPRNKLQKNSTQNKAIFLQENEFENVVWRGQPFCLSLKMLLIWLGAEYKISVFNYGATTHIINNYIIDLIKILIIYISYINLIPFHWRHNDHNGFSNHQPHWDADQRRHQSSASLAFVWGIHRDWWIPHTKGQLRGKCFHLMTSSCNVSNAVEWYIQTNCSSQSEIYFRIYVLENYYLNQRLSVLLIILLPCYWVAFDYILSVTWIAFDYIRLVTTIVPALIRQVLVVQK